jgi:predicted DNA-binding protein
MDRQGTRVNLTLSDELIRVLDRMTAVTGSGRATIIREILEDAAPGLAQMATALEEAHRGNVDSALRTLGRTLQENTVTSEQMSLDIARTRRRAARRKPK